MSFDFPVTMSVTLTLKYLVESRNFFYNFVKKSTFSTYCPYK